MSKLIDLGLAALGLEIDPGAGGRMAIDLMAAADPVELETKRLSQALGVGGADVGKLAVGQAVQ